MKNKSASKVFKALANRLNKHLAVVSKDRDCLRRLKDEIEDVLEPMDRVVDALDDAITALSEMESIKGRAYTSKTI